MPKETKQRVGNQPTVESVSRPQDLRVVARPVDQTVVPGTQDSVLGELVAGLSSINPQLQQYVQQKNTTDAFAAMQRGEEDANRNTLGFTDPRQALKAPEAMPETIEPAFSKQYQTAYRNVIGAKTAEKLSSDMLDAWSKERMNADADPERFLEQWGAQNLVGFDDPEMLGHITKKVMETAKAIRGDARSIAMAQLEKSTKEGIQALYGELTPDIPVAQMMDRYFLQIVPQAMQTNFYTRTDLNGMLLDKVRSMSIAMGGAPERFDMLKEFKDPTTGRSIYESSPALAEKIDAYRAEAERQMTGKLDKAMQENHYRTALEWDRRAAEGNPPTADEVLVQMGPLGMFKSYSEAANAYLRYQKDADVARATQQGMYLMANGFGAALPEKDQKKYMDALTDSAVSAVFQAAAAGDMDQFNLGVSQILQMHKKARVSVANTRLQNLFGSVRQNAPAKGEEPSPTFKALAGIYSQLPPNLQSAYVTDEDSRLILSRYNEARSGGAGTQLDEASAYAQAHASVSKEAKDRGQQLLGTTEGREAVRKKISKTFAVMGWRAFLPFANAGNEDVVAAATTNAARGFVERMGGNVSEKEMLDWSKQWFTERFVYDKTSGNYVEVPPTASGESTAEAISEYMAKITSKWGKELNPQIVYRQNGRYQVLSGVGAILEDTTLRDITDDHYALKNLDPRTNEPSRMLALQNGLTAGTLTPQQLVQEAGLVAKAQALHLWGDAESKKIDALRKKAFEENLSPILQDVPQGSLVGADNSRLPANGASTKGDLAKLYFERNHDGKALTVLAEGVVLKAYPDPATGRNIGVAYNMDANARTLKEDFRRAGIPADAVEDVKAGKKAITMDQAIRLFEVSYARAESSARNSIEKLYGKGSWDKLPSNRKAVLTDVAYQAGNVDQFKPTLDKCLAGIGELKDQNPKVHYKDRETKLMKADEPRNHMRLTVLNGGRSVKGLIDRVTGIPRNKIESQALLNPQ